MGRALAGTPVRCALGLALCLLAARSVRLSRHAPPPEVCTRLYFGGACTHGPLRPKPARGLASLERLPPVRALAAAPLLLSRHDAHHRAAYSRVVPSGGDGAWDVGVSHIAVAARSWAASA